MHCCREKAYTAYDLLLRARAQHRKHPWSPFRGIPQRRELALPRVLDTCGFSLPAINSGVSETPQSKFILLDGGGDRLQVRHIAKDLTTGAPREPNNGARNA